MFLSMFRSPVPGQFDPFDAGELNGNSRRRNVPLAIAQWLGKVAGAAASLVSAARESGAKVLMLEAAPEVYRGGNSRHTRNFRCMHSGSKGVLQGEYDEDEHLDDLLKVTKGRTDLDLARFVIRSSEGCYQWMQDHGVRFQLPLSGTLSLSRTNAFFLGGGKSLVNAYCRTASALGVRFAYEAPVAHLELDGGRITRVDAKVEGRSKFFFPCSVVVASGGFQGDIEWMAKAWGPAARNFLVRGTPYNRGVVLRDLIDQGADTVGDPTQCHTVAIDGRAPNLTAGLSPVWTACLFRCRQQERGAFP